jgi:hypothetical protein
MFSRRNHGFKSAIGYAAARLLRKKSRFVKNNAFSGFDAKAVVMHMYDVHYDDKPGVYAQWI